MAVIEIRREHALGIDELRRRVEQLAVDLEQDLDARYQWQGDTLSFSRSGASGTVELGEGEVAVRVKLGMLHSALKGRIEKVLDERLDEVLA